MDGEKAPSFFGSAPTTPTPSSKKTVPKELKIGTRVSLKREGNKLTLGTIKFIGNTKFAIGEWIGVELDDNTGKNDGTVQGERYFLTDNNRGIFVRREFLSLVGQGSHKRKRNKRSMEKLGLDPPKDPQEEVPRTSKSPKPDQQKMRKVSSNSTDSIKSPKPETHAKPRELNVKSPKPETNPKLSREHNIKSPKPIEKGSSSKIPPEQAPKPEHSSQAPEIPKTMPKTTPKSTPKSTPSPKENHKGSSGDVVLGRSKPREIKEKRYEDTTASGRISQTLLKPRTMHVVATAPAPNQKFLKAKAKFNELSKPNPISAAPVPHIKKEDPVSLREKVAKDKEQLAKEKSALEKERNEFLKQKEELEQEILKVSQEKEKLSQEKEKFSAEKSDFLKGIHSQMVSQQTELFISEKETIEKEKQSIEKEKENLEKERQHIAQERLHLHHEKHHINEEKKTLLQNQEVLEEEKQVFQKDKDQLEEERKELLAEKQLFSQEKDAFASQKLSFQEEKDLFEKEKLSILEAQKNTPEKPSIETPLPEKNLIPRTPSSSSLSRVKPLEDIPSILKNTSVVPLIFAASNEERLQSLLASGTVWQFSDTIRDQLHELVSIRFPTEIDIHSKKWENLPPTILDMLKDDVHTLAVEKLGNYVYFPWNGSLIHLLPKKVYRELRLSGNRHVIVEPEQISLCQLTFGIIGLTHSKILATSLALEGLGGYFRLFDNQTMDLTSLNSSLSSTTNIGVSVAVDTARALYEIDPYLDVQIFNDVDSLDQFLGNDSFKLTLLFDQISPSDPEELQTIKHAIRRMARERNIPVISFRCDRGIWIEVQRHDLEPNLPLIFHHKFEHDIPTLNKALSGDIKINLNEKLLRKIPPRVLSSALELNRTITKVPILAGNVAFAAGLTVILARRISLNTAEWSGRMVIDVDDLLREEFLEDIIEDDYPENMEELQSMIETNRIPFSLPKNKISGLLSPGDVINVIAHAVLAPSYANLQPWKFVFLNNKGELICKRNPDIDVPKSDPYHLTECVAMGAAIENIYLYSRSELKKNMKLEWLHKSETPSNEICSLSFEELKEKESESLKMEQLLTEQIPLRYTIRKMGMRDALSKENETKLRSSVTGFPVVFRLITQRDGVNKLAELMSESERIHYLTAELRHDLINHVRFTKGVRTQDGLEIDLFESSEKLLFNVLRYDSVMSLLAALEKRTENLIIGSLLTDWPLRLISTSVAVGYIAVPKTDSYSARCRSFFEAGRAFQRLWLTVTSLGYCLQPMNTLVSLHQVAQTPKGSVLSNLELLKELFEEMKNQFALDTNCGITSGNKNEDIVVLFRIFKLDPTQYPRPSLRRPIGTILEFVEERSCQVMKTQYEFTARNNRELTILPTENVVVLNQDKSGWWKGINMENKKSGWFPSNYVKPINQTVQVKYDPALFEEKVEPATENNHQNSQENKNLSIKKAVTSRILELGQLTGEVPPLSLTTKNGKPKRKVVFNSNLEQKQESAEESGEEESAEEESGEESEESEEEKK